jgi:hypothetical protein
MDALGIALIVIGLALVCGGLILPRGFSEKPNEESSQVSLDPVERRLLEDPEYAETLRRLNAMEPEVRNERGNDHRPGG